MPERKQSLILLSFVIVLLLATGGFGCLQDSVGSASDQPSDSPEVPITMVQPQLGPLDVATPGTDAAIWVHPADPARSLLFLGTSAGWIYAYDLAGDLRQSVDLEVVLPNGESSPALAGIDVRTGFDYGGESIDILAGNLSAHGKLAVLRINPDAQGGDVLTILADQHGRQNNISANSGAFTLAKRMSDGAIYAVDQSRSSGAAPRQYEVTEADGAIVTREVRAFDDHAWTPGAGFVADDELGFLYLGEESVGVNKYDADPDAGAPGRLALLATADGIRGKREGLALYSCEDGSGYLVLATEDAEPLSGRQTSSSRFMVYERRGANRLVKEFLAVDSIHTGGFAVSAAPVPGFAAGFALLHVDAGSGRQFFAYSFADIAADDLPVCP